MENTSVQSEPAIKDQQSGKLNPVILVIFGITGDLSRRKLLPALYQLVKNNLLPEHTKIIGVSRRESTLDELMDSVELCVREENGICDPEVVSKLQSLISMRQMDLTSPEHYQNLKKYLDQIEADESVCMNRLFYLSIPPQVLTPIIKNLGEQKLTIGCQHGNGVSRILFEKPFGFDYNSGKELIETNKQYLHEEQIFRIDHYVAKETVQNILTFRFRNPIFEDLWNAHHIDHIEIIAKEKIDIEGRANFYEQTGALRDLMQSHMMQLLATVAMEKPFDFSAEPIHASKLELLNDVKTVPADRIAERAVRGQYDGYRDEVGIPDSNNETFAAIKLQIDNPRWDGVPFYLKTGKALDEKSTKIAVHFKPKMRDTHHLNKLNIFIQPNEGISLDLWVKKPGFERDIQQAKMGFSYQQTFDETGHPDAYERVLVDAIRGDKTLFATSEEVMESWRILEPVLEHWQAGGSDLKFYQKGSAGPELPEGWD